jgi:hypothetical protein
VLVSLKVLLVREDANSVLSRAATQTPRSVLPSPLTILTATDKFKFADVLDSAHEN